MSKMGEYAIQHAEELARQGNRRKKQSEPNNVPTVFRDQQIDAKIAECIMQGMDELTAVVMLVEWNAKQASPMKIGLVKKRVYVAYRDRQTASS